MYKYHLAKNYLFQEPYQLKDFLLRQIGRLYMQPCDSVGLHRQANLFELTIITGGTGTCFANVFPKVVKRGDIYLSFPNELHNIVSSKDDPLQFDFFAFETADPVYQQKLQSIAEHYSQKERVFSDERIVNLVSDCIAEFNNEDPDLLYCMFKSIMIHLIRNFPLNEEKTKTLAARSVSTAESFCYQMMHYVDTHVCSIQNLEEIANVLNYNYSYLSALFKKTTGQTLSTYYQQKRLETAKLLMADPSLSITQIAEKLNYSSLYTFSRAFKLMFGVSPREYHKSVREHT